MKSCNKTCPYMKFAFLLLVVGGLNWGLVGIFNFDLVAAIFGDMTTVSRIVYILVGVSAVYVCISKMMCMKKGCRGGSCENGVCKGGKCVCDDGASTKEMNM